MKNGSEMSGENVLEMHRLPQGQASRPLVYLEGIGKRFGQLAVLRGVNLSVEQGEIVAIIGTSGSGRSTLLRCVNQLEVRSQGTVTVAGVTVGPGGTTSAKDLRKLRRSVGMVFQSFNLFPHLTVLRDVAQILTSCGLDASAADVGEPRLIK